MYGTESITEESERSAFRKVEKKYKLYFDHNTKRKIKHPKAVDLSQVIDFNSILQSFNQNAQLPPGVTFVGHQFNLPVLSLDKRPGFYFIPGALSVDEQCRWIRESLTTFPQPPNRTNHNAIYGPIHDLFLAAKERKVLVQDETPLQGLVSDENVVASDLPLKWKSSEGVGGVSSKENACKSTPASTLLRKLRWATLGLQFDWSKRCYNLTLPHNKIPDPLCQLAKKMAAPAMPLNEEFKPEAAIVNYFGSGDMLGGHLDDMEADWSKPIVSMSLGCKAIFLLGGKSREDEPIAMFLRSGDIVLMAGEARECFHGVPRIFTDKENAEISHLELQLSHDDDIYFMDYIKSSRININIRQVF